MYNFTKKISIIQAQTCTKYYKVVLGFNYTNCEGDLGVGVGADSDDGVDGETSPYA
jgi:hypothetical protein